MGVGLGLGLGLGLGSGLGSGLGLGLGARVQTLHSVRFDLNQASQLCTFAVPDNTQLQVELQVGPVHQTSNVTLAEHGAARWVRARVRA